MTNSQLKVKARERGLTGYSRWRKAELIDKLFESGVTFRNRTAAPEEYDLPQFLNVVKQTVKQLREAAKIQGLTGYSRLRKVELINRLYDSRPTFDVVESVSALRRFTEQFKIDGTRYTYDPDRFLVSTRPAVIGILENHRNVKTKIVLYCIMKKILLDPPPEEPPAVEKQFRSKIHVNLEATDLYDLYDTMVDQVKEEIAKLQREGSNWVFVSILKLVVHTVEYRPLQGNSWIPLPKTIALKEAIINMKNEDNKCFLWSVLRVLNPVNKNAERIDKKLKALVGTIDMNGVEYPVSLHDIDKVEKHNPTLAINVLGLDGGCIYTPRISSNVNGIEVNLLLISNDQGVQHYCIVKDKSRLLSKQTVGHHGKRHFCMRCINSFKTQASLDNHIKYCSTNEVVRVEMPEDGSTIKFKNYKNSERVPFIVYADFESFIKPIATCASDSTSSYTNKYQKHVPSSFCYVIKTFEGSKRPVKYTATSDDDNVAQKFVDSLLKDIKALRVEYGGIKKMVLTDVDKANFNKSTECWICRKVFDKSGKYEIIVIIQVNIEELPIGNVIYNFKNQDSPPLYFIISVATIVTCL